MQLSSKNLPLMLTRHVQNVVGPSKPRASSHANHVCSKDIGNCIFSRYNLIPIFAARRSPIGSRESEEGAKISPCSPWQSSRGDAGCDDVVGIATLHLVSCATKASMTSYTTGQ